MQRGYFTVFSSYTCMVYGLWSLKELFPTKLFNPLSGSPHSSTLSYILLLPYTAAAILLKYIHFACFFIQRNVIIIFCNANHLSLSLSRISTLELKGCFTFAYSQIRMHFTACTKYKFSLQNSLTFSG